MKKAIFVKYPHVGFVLKCKLWYLLTIFTSHIWLMIQHFYLWELCNLSALSIHVFQYFFKFSLKSSTTTPSAPLFPPFPFFSPTRKPMLPSSSHPASTPHHHHPSRQGQTRCCHRRASHCRSPVAVDVVAIVDLRHSPYCSSCRHQMEKKKIENGRNEEGASIPHFHGRPIVVAITPIIVSH